MKMLMNLIIVLFAALTLAACEKTVDPVSPVSLDKSNFNGTFDVTFQNYKNSSQNVTLTGTIDFSFDNSTYSYNAVILHSSNNEVSGTLSDSGTYLINGDKISLLDNATRRMNPGWLPSLYLSWDFNYSTNANQTIIEGSYPYGLVRIVLSSQ